MIALKQVLNSLGLLLAISKAADSADQTRRTALDTPNVYIAHREPFRRDVICEDGDFITAYLLPNGRVRLSDRAFFKEFNGSELGAQLDERIKTRAIWLLLIGADRRVSFGALAEVITLAQQHADYVGLITTSVEKGKGCLTVSVPGIKEHGR